jgi:beta-xylosidase
VKIEEKKNTLARTEPVDREKTNRFFRDDFNSASLDKRWSWVRGKHSRWSLTEKPGFLTIHTERGEIFERNSDGRNILLMKAPNGDFMVEAKIEIHPLKHWQQAGLMVYWNDNDYLKIDYLLDSDRALKVEFSSESNGRYTKRFKIYRVGQC